MKRLFFAFIAALISAILFGCAPTPTPPVTVTLRNANGAVVGNASLTQDANGVWFSLQVKGLPPGKHGWHIHTIGKCDPPDFMSAGAHFNPENKQHGLNNPSGPHAGDSPNLDVAQDGAGSVEYVNPRVTLAAGANSLFKPDGTAIIIHAQEDDQKTDPTGNSGGRIACGLILK